jgi:glycopeptide antibiotics resistance protein
MFVIYALLLVGVILFKLPFGIDGIESIRVINLVPFMGFLTEGGGFSTQEVIENLIVFIPLGVYLCMLKRDWSFVQKLVVIFGTTLAFESIQFIFAIGRSDVTDLLSNTLGGIIGIGIYVLLTKVLKSRTDTTINIVALVLMAGVVLLFAMMMLRIRLPF